jgi:hypothetical protein
MSVTFSALSVLAVATQAPSWWEPGTPNFLDVGDMSAVFAFTLAVLGALRTAVRKTGSALREMMREEISIATEPIQPTSNGGLSLADVARRTKQLEETIEKVYELQQKNNKLYTKVLEKVFELESEIDTRIDDTKKPE